MTTRISIPDYAMSLAHVASLRSEDPVRKVGAVALTRDNRVIATAYNGLAAGETRSDHWWSIDGNRRYLVIHAEMNLCSLFERNQVHAIAVTTAPCSCCAKLIAAHGIKIVYFGEPYATDPSGLLALNEYGINAIHVPGGILDWRKP